ncbi:relaxin receptor 2-like [Paramacrobiotus metropolitanus]|uniref:relaxin receptor 2-like n=1 Tax=Paramacrobiotus metropolitanus TaxID=2943436 RepID=UPI0024458168|nr:relaxin receptor 2-like [Paramacrobiotus metropolitanus]
MWRYYFVVRLLLLLTDIVPLICIQNLMPLTTKDEGIKFHKNHECETGEFPCATSSKCLAQRYWCDEIKDCPEGDDENEKYCGEKTSGFGRAFFRRIQDSDKETTEDCLAPEPLLPPGTGFHHHIGTGNVTCFVKRFPKRCQCVVNQIKCDNLSLTSVFPFNEEYTDTSSPIYTFSKNRIQFIQEDALAMFPNLQKLDFRHNSISGLNLKAFNNLSELRHLHLDYNKLSKIDPRVFSNLRNLCFLWLGQNLIQNWEPNSFNNKKLRWLDLKANRISLEAGMFAKLSSLYYLELERNEIRHISKDHLNGLTSLLYLDLSSNLIENIEENSFEATPRLEELSLANNTFTTLPSHLFAPLQNLQFLNLSANPGILSLPMEIFKGLSRLDRLNLSGVSINNIHKDMFKDIPNEALIIFSKFHYCYYAAHIVDCFPKSDGISSSENMIDLLIPRIMIWALIALIPLVNLTVLLARCCIASTEPIMTSDVPQRYHRHEQDVTNKLRYNLFVSYLLMAVYLLVIAIYDIQFRENYHREAYEWLHGTACQAAGMLASLSIFISLVTMCAILADLCICITKPRKYHLSSRGAVWLIVNMWFAGLMLFGIPVAVWDNVTGSFYGNNGLCIPLYLDEPYLNGWWYSSLLFFGVFTASLIITVFCGMRIKYFLATNSHSKELLTELKWDLYDFRRYLIIMIVNLICWLPVIVVKMIAFTSFDIANHIHSFYAIVVLPANSFLTPLLHAQMFTDIRRKLVKACSLFLRGHTRFLRNESFNDMGHSTEVKVDSFFHQSIVETSSFRPRSHSPNKRPVASQRPTPSPVERINLEASERLLRPRSPEVRPRSF